MRSKKTAIIIFFLVISLLAMAIPSNVTLKMKMCLLSSFSPILKVGNFILLSINHVFCGMAGYRSLIKTNLKLKGQVEELTQEIMALKEASIENERLRGLLAFKKKISYKTIPARVIARDLTNWYSSIIIDKGSKEGLKEDMALTAPSGLVGRLSEVHPSLSRAILIVDPNSRVGAIVQRSRAQGVVEGSLKGRLRMKYIPLDADIEEGDIVITSGMGGIFPKGMAIGKVESVGTESHGLHLYAWVEPIVDFSKLEEVLCIVRGR